MNNYNIICCYFLLFFLQCFRVFVHAFIIHIFRFFLLSFSKIKFIPDEVKYSRLSVTIQSVCSLAGASARMFTWTCDGASNCRADTSRHTPAELTHPYAVAPLRCIPHMYKSKRKNKRLFLQSQSCILHITRNSVHVVARVVAIATLVEAQHDTSSVRNTAR
jgi:hypothetical protein